jgi:hypothetical protein
MILASGDFDRDLFRHPGRLIQRPTEDDIQYLLTFLLADARKNVHYGKYRLVNTCMRPSSEVFPGLDHECRREVLGP